MPKNENNPDKQGLTSISDEDLDKALNELDDEGEGVTPVSEETTTRHPGASDILNRYSHPALQPKKGTPEYIEWKAALKQEEDRLVESLKTSVTQEHEENVLKGNTLGTKPKTKQVEGLLEMVVRKKAELTQEDTVDAAERALAALKRVREYNRKKRIRLWCIVVGLLVVVGSGLYGGWMFVQKQMLTGHYTVVAECKVPYGDFEITGKRYYRYAYQSILGYHLVDEGTVEEVTEVKLPGDKIIILGFDASKGNWWRMNYDRGEFGTVKLKPTDKYWFVGEKDRTTLVPYHSFCH